MCRRAYHIGCDIADLLWFQHVDKSRHFGNAGVGIVLRAHTMTNGRQNVVDGTAPQPVVIVEVRIAGCTLCARTVALHAVDVKAAAPPAIAYWRRFSSARIQHVLGLIWSIMPWRSLSILAVSSQKVPRLDQPSTPLVELEISGQAG